MPRILTIAALLPALGASTAALAQAAPWAPPQAQAPYPPAAYDRQLSWPGRAQVHPSSQTAPAYPAASADGFAPPQEAAYFAPPAAQTVARPAVIPHGGYPWRAGAPGYNLSLIHI